MGPTERRDPARRPAVWMGGAHPDGRTASHALLQPRGVQRLWRPDGSRHLSAACAVTRTHVLSVGPARAGGYWGLELATVDA